MYVNQRRTVRIAILALGTAALLSAATGCAANGGAASGPSSSPNQGTVLVGGCIGAGPYGDFAADGTTYESFEADMIRAIAKKQGLEVGFSVIDNVGLFTALDSGRLDILACGMVDKKSRQKKYNLLDDATDQTGFLVRKGDAGRITNMDDACGLKLGVTAGTSQEAFWTDFTKQCAAKGKPAVKLLTFKNESDSFTALRSGQIEAMSTNSPLLDSFAANSNGATEVVPNISYLKGYVGLVFPKNSPLTAKFQKGLQELIDSGEYAQIMNKWNLGYLEIKKAELNQGTAE